MAHDSSYYCVKTLRFLKWFETHWKLEVPVKDVMQTVKWKINVLQAFFIHKRKWHIDDKNLQLHLCHTDKVVYDTTQNFILSKGKCWTFQEKLCLKISGVIEKLDMTKPHIRQVYAIISKSRRSTCSEVGDVIELLQVLLELLKNYFSRRAYSNFPLTEERQALEENLRYLRIFLELDMTCCDRHEILRGLLTHAEAVTDSAACLLYLCCEESEMDDDTVNEMKDEISCLVRKIKPFQPNVREVYIKALNGLESSLQDVISVDEPVLHFLYTLLGHMIELSNAKERFNRSVMDQIEALHEELQIISCYLFDPSCLQYTQKIKKVSHLLLRIKVVLCHAAYAIYASYDSDITEEMAGELNLRIADLLLEIEVIKTKSRNVYINIIPKSLRSNFTKTNELGFMDFVIKNLQELLSLKADSILQLQYQLEMVLGSILSLREDFFEIGELFREQEELREPWIRFKDIVYQTEFAIDSFIARSGHLWEWKLGLFDILQQIKISREVNAIKINRTTNT